MKAKDLIEKLSKMDQNKDLMFKYENENYSIEREAIIEESEESIIIKDPKVQSVKEEASPMTTLDAVPGMGAPVLASRGIVGSGDIASPGPKKKKKKLKSYTEFKNQN